MKKLLLTYKNEHYYYVLESLYTQQIFIMPLCILVNDYHLLNEYWECPQSEKMCTLKIEFNEVVNCFSEKPSKYPHTFSESNTIVR